MYKFQPVCVYCLGMNEVFIKSHISQLLSKKNIILLCCICNEYWECKYRFVAWPFPRCTCACESASALSQYQQAAFHRSVTEAYKIRAESTQNNHAELRANPEPKHQRECQDTGSSIIRQESTPKKNTESGCVAIVQPHLYIQDVMGFGAWGHCRTSVPPANSGCIYTFLHKFLFYMEAGVQKVGSFVNGMCIEMALWKSLRASGHFAEVSHECPPLCEHCTIVHRTPLRWLMWSLMLPLHRILFYGYVKCFGWKTWFSATTYVLQSRHLIQQCHLNLHFLSSNTPLTHIPHPTSSLLKYKMAIVQFGCQSVMRLCVFKNAWCERCPVLTSGTSDHFFIAALLTSVPRHQDWRVREKAPSNYRGMRLRLCQRDSAGRHYPKCFVFPQQPCPFLTPESTHFPPLLTFISGCALITEFPANCPNRLSCVAMCALGCFGHKMGLQHKMWFGFQLPKSSYFSFLIAEQTTAWYLSFFARSKAFDSTAPDSLWYAGQAEHSTDTLTYFFLTRLVVKTRSTDIYCTFPAFFHLLLFQKFSKVSIIVIPLDRQTFLAAGIL